MLLAPVARGDLPHATPVAVGLNPSAIREAETVIARQVEQGDIAGVSLCVMRSGRVAHLKAYGFRDALDRLPARTDDIYRIYSMSKPIVSVAAMQLWEQGHFELDDPLADYIPAFRHMRVLETTRDANGKPAHRLVPAKREITIRDVFRHTTGIAYGGSLPEPVNRHYVANDLVYWYEGMYAPKCSLLDGMTRLGRVPLLHHPGARWTYGLNVDILGRLIEVWTGQQLSAHLSSSLFGPLGMTDTAFHVPDGKLHRFGPVHDKKNGAFYRISAAHSSPYQHPPQWESGGGGLVGTITDYARFCQAVLDSYHGRGSHPVLKPETTRLMFSNQLPKAESRRFGLGFGVVEFDIGEKDSRRRRTAYRWGGYASTKFHIIPSEELILVTMRQRIPGNAVTWNKIVPILHRGLRPLAHATEK